MLINNKENKDLKKRTTVFRTQKTVFIWFLDLRGNFFLPIYKHIPLNQV